MLQKIVVKSLARQGFIQAVHGTLRIEEDWIQTSGLPCSSFVWINRYTNKRSDDNPLGDESLAYVRNANKLACRYCLVVCVAIARQVYVFCEQPSSSKFVRFPYLVHIMCLLKDFLKLSVSFLL